MWLAAPRTSRASGTVADVGPKRNQQQIWALPTRGPGSVTSYYRT